MESWKSSKSVYQRIIVSENVSFKFALQLLSSKWIETSE